MPVPRGVMKWSRFPHSRARQGTVRLRDRVLQFHVQPIFCTTSENAAMVGDNGGQDQGNGSREGSVGNLRWQREPKTIRLKQHLVDRMEQLQGPRIKIVRNDILTDYITDASPASMVPVAFHAILTCHLFPHSRCHCCRRRHHHHRSLRQPQRAVACRPGSCRCRTRRL